MESRRLLVGASCAHGAAAPAVGASGVERDTIMRDRGDNVQAEQYEKPASTPTSSTTAGAGTDDSSRSFKSSSRTALFDPADDPELAPSGASTQVEFGTLDVCVRRLAIYRRHVLSSDCCPECRGPLRQEMCVYAVCASTRNGSTTYFAGSDFGWFCLNCPTVLIDRAGVESLLDNLADTGTSVENYVILGLVDLDAAEQGQSDRPIFDMDSPPEVIAFLNSCGGTTVQPSNREEFKRQKRRRQKAARQRTR